ncbi:MAG: right-handed parallel beta-helix repeat-containing protein [bacterium]
MWYGTIIVTGDITVPAGNTLTIAEGTNVLFVYADVDAPANVGDYRITVNGNLIVNGTAANPVVFSGQGAAAKKKGGWDSIVLNGAGSVLNHAIIEYGDVALELKSDVELNNVEVRQASNDCIRLNNADNAALNTVHAHDCANDGVAVLGGSTGVTIDTLTSDNNGRHGLSDGGGSNIAVTNSVLKDNAFDGAYIDGSATAFNLSDSTVENNTRMGIRVGGNATGTITQNQIRQNGAEGISFYTEASGSPSIVVNYNNIYSNASVGSSSSTLDTINISASQTCCSTSTSGLFTAPAGTLIRRVYVNYNEGTEYGSYVSGQLLDQNNAVLRNYTVDTAGWVYVPEGVTAIRVRVTDTGSSSSTDTIAATQVEYVGFTGADEVVAATETGTVDLRYNYLGTFPNVLSRVALARTNALNLQGFVGVAFGPTWDVGPYKAGPVGGQTWSGTIYITGDTTIAAGQALTVAAGTQVLFVNHDQDLDTNGDFSITATGAMNVNGTVGNRVRFAGYGAVEADMFQTINLNGSAADSSNWTDALIENAKTGMTLRGSAVLTRVEAQSDSANAFDLLAGSGASLTRCIADGGAADGVFINGATNVAISRLTSRNHTGNGVVVLNNSTATIEDSTIRDNGVHGVKIERASPALNYNLITYNGGDGIWIGNAASPTITYSVIKFNDGAGVSAWTGANGSATPTANYNNIYSNAVTGNTTVVTGNAGISASQTCCSTSTSSLFSAPADHTIRRVYVNYNEGTEYGSYVSGQLLDQNGTVLRNYTVDSAGWVYVPDGVTGIRVRVTDTGSSSSTDTISAAQVEMVTNDPLSVYEFYSATEAGTSNAKFNYWTPDIGNVPTKIYQLRPGSVDYTGFTGAEYPSGAVTVIGPRP